MFIDTSGFYCFFDRKDVRHNDARTFVSSAERLVTHSYVLAEFVPLCQTRGLERTKFLEFVETLFGGESVEIVWVDERLHKTAHRLLRQRADKNYSLCDAASFVIMRERGINEALTTDKHFEQENFVRLLKF